MRLLFVACLLFSSISHSQTMVEKLIEEDGLKFIEVHLPFEDITNNEHPIAIKNIVVLFNSSWNKDRSLIFSRYLFDNKINNAVFYISTLPGNLNAIEKEMYVTKLLKKVQTRKYYLDSNLYVVSKGEYFDNYNREQANAEITNKEYLLKISDILITDKWNLIEKFILKLK